MDERAPASPADEAEKTEPKSDAQRAWYVLHTYSGYEKKVKRNLERQIEERGLPGEDAQRQELARLLRQQIDQAREMCIKLGWVVPS